MLTYGIFLFLSIFPIIHPKGLAQMPEENMENTKLLPLGTEQGLEETEYHIMIGHPLPVACPYPPGDSTRCPCR